MTKEAFKQLAEAYFSGKIAREDEQRLMDFVNQSEANEQCFRAWEKEWSQQDHFDILTERAWRQLALRLFGEPARQYASRPWWHYAAAAVAVLVLMVGTSVGTWLLSTGGPEQFYALTAPLGSKIQLRLPDGSQVWLNAGSTLRYSTKFNSKHRNVELEGEGYFEVAQCDGKEFTVRTPGYDVVVKGTRFNVSAYKDDKYITTTLMQGSVLIDRDEDHLLMKPGEMVRLDVNSGVLTKSQFDYDAHAWTLNMAEYDDITLSQFAKVLSRQYAVQVHISSEHLRDMRFSISLRNKETIDDVLHALQRFTDINVCRSGKDIYISE